jgi:Na+/H+ antiporter NhaD/arsenite permease-like protein
MIMAPVALAYTRKYHLNPVSLLIGMAVASNLQGCATMVGDSPSIILAMESGMNFNDFFYMPAAKLGLPVGRPGLFLFVQFGALLSFPILYAVFRKEKKVYKLEKEIFKVRSWVPVWLLVTMIVSLAVSSFFQNRFAFFPLVICLFFGLAGMTWLKLSHNEKISKEHIDWESFFLLLGIFLLVGSIKKAGFIDSLAGYLAGAGTKSPFLLYLIIVWMSVAVSAFVDNIPYTLAMVSCVKTLAVSIQVNPYIFLFGLLLGTCIGGNITPIGASCNVVGVGILKKNGYRVGFLDFVRIGLPFTLAAVAGSSLLMWLVYTRG